MTIVALFALGLLCLVFGAEALVRGAARLAAFLGISPLVVGLTVVAFGTSSPELGVSMLASFSGQSDIALGNVIGSNIANILFILGFSAAITPLLVTRHLIRLDVPIMIGVSLLMLLFGLDRKIVRSEGLLLLGIGVGYTWFLVYQSRKETRTASSGHPDEGTGYGQGTRGRWLANLGLVLGGLLVLVLGARWLVEAAVAIARALGVSELIIGLTVVAAGTSLPEAATSIVASIRGERDLAVGNAVGSNIFNILVVLALCSILAPGGIKVSASALRFDLPVMIAVAVACLPIFFTGSSISRWEGFLFLGYYAAYTAYLFLRSTQHRSLPVFSEVMLLFVIPLTAITLITVSLGSLRSNRRKDPRRHDSER